MSPNPSPICVFPPDAVGFAKGPAWYLGITALTCLCLPAAGNKPSQE